MLMNSLFAHLCNLIECEEGQDLVEYSLVVALIAFGAVAGMSSLAGGLNTVFLNVSTTLSSSIT